MVSVESFATDGWIPAPTGNWDWSLSWAKPDHARLFRERVRRRLLDLSEFLFWVPDPHEVIDVESAVSPSGVVMLVTPRVVVEVRQSPVQPRLGVWFRATDGWEGTERGTQCVHLAALEEPAVLAALILRRLPATAPDRVGSL